MKKLLTLLAIAMMISSCSIVPVTGRRQLNMIPDSTMLSMKTSFAVLGVFSFAFFSMLCSSRSWSREPQFIQILIGLLYLIAHSIICL